MTVTIKTDHKWRDLVYRLDVPDHILKDQFDYQDADDACDGFFCYRGYWYHLDGFMTISNNPALAGWDGYASDSYFSGVVIKIDQNCERVKIGTYYS